MFEVFDYVHLDHHQHVNHFRNDREVRAGAAAAGGGPP